jgi:DNA-directed RNA polymerase
MTENSALSVYRQQIELEKSMREETIKRYHRLHKKARERGEYASTHTGRAVLNHSIDAFEDAIDKFKADSNTGKPGKRHTAAVMLDTIDTASVAYLFTQAILNVVPISMTEGETAALSSVSIKGCTKIHDEMRIRHFSANHFKLCRKMLTDFDTRDLPRRRRKEMIQRKFSQMKMEWEVWDKRQMVLLGRVLVELFGDATGMCKIAQVWERGKKRRIVQPTPDMLFKIDERLKANEGVFTVMLPMLTKPKPWLNGQLFGGGYFTENITSYPLVKGIKSQFLEEMNNMDLSVPLRAINAIQEVPFRISAVMPDLLEHVYSLNREIAGLPLSDQEPIPEAPAGADEDGDIKNAYRRQCYLVHDHNRRRISKRLMVARVIHLAKKFESAEELYFPVQLCSRGRIYDVSTFLNRQGPDFVKGQLEFAQGKSIENEEQAAWLAIMGANHFGKDKLPLQERADWVVDNEHWISEVAADPFGDLRWTEADEPFQFVRWAMEWSNFRREGFGYVSHLPCNVDATCSGMQIFSAALRDREGARWVNLTDRRDRQDIYIRVADLSNGKFEAETDPEKLPLAKAALEFGIRRAETKKPCMVIPYSGTFHAVMTYVRESIHKRTKAGETHPYIEDDSKFIAYIASKIWDSIHETIPAARECMLWMQKASRLVSESDTPIPLVWFTPDGFPVQQARYEQKHIRVSTFLDGIIYRLSLFEDTKKLDRKKMASSIAPNWVHSLDGAILRGAVNFALDQELDFGRGPVYYNTIHDSFGTHCADLPDFLEHCIKPSFLQIFHDNDPLADFENEVAKIINQSAGVLPPAPQRGDFDITEVIKNDFFFS